MIERGGKLRLVPIADAKIEIIEPVLEQAHLSRCHTSNRRPSDLRDNRWA